MIHLKNAVKFLWIIILLTNFGELSACTSFILKNGHQVVVGRNYDYKSSLGVIMINSRNVIKTAIPFPGEKSVEWISKYGSITFNSRSHARRFFLLLLLFLLLPLSSSRLLSSSSSPLLPSSFPLPLLRRVKEEEENY